MEEQQAELFLIFAAFGAACMLVYDLLRALRREVRHAAIVLMLEDVLFCAAACAGCYAIFFCKNQGALRAYGFLGILVGAILYHFTLGKPMQLCFRKVLKIVLFPLRWVQRKCKIWKSIRKSLTKQKG